MVSSLGFLLFPVNLGQFVYHTNTKVASSALWSMWIQFQIGSIEVGSFAGIPCLTDQFGNSVSWFLLAESSQLCCHFFFQLNPWLSTHTNTESVRLFRPCLCRFLVFIAKWTCGAFTCFSHISFFWSAQVVVAFPCRYKATTVLHSDACLNTSWLQEFCDSVQFRRVLNKWYPVFRVSARSVAHIFVFW